MAYVYEYLVFLAQAVTVVAAMLIVLSAVASLVAKKTLSGHGAPGSDPAQ